MKFKSFIMLVPHFGSDHIDTIFRGSADFTLITGHDNTSNSYRIKSNVECWPDNFM